MVCAVVVGFGVVVGRSVGFGAAVVGFGGGVADLRGGSRGGWSFFGVVFVAEVAVCGDGGGDEGV